MRLLLVISGLEVGGAETQVIRLSQRLALRGHEVDLFVLTNQVSRLAEIAPELVSVIIAPKRRKLDFSVLNQLRQLIHERKYDCAMSFLYDANIYLRLASIGMPLKVFNTERSSSYQLKLANLWFHRITRWRVDGLIANSNAGRLHAINYLGYAQSRCSIVWNGIDNEDVARLLTHIPLRAVPEFPNSLGHKTILWIGKIAPVKDPHLAVRTLAELRKESSRWRLVMVGGDPSFGGAYAKSLLKLIDELGVRGAVSLIGPRDDIHRLLPHAGLLLSTSQYEGFPNAVLEAMQADVPVISTDYSDIKHILPCDWQVCQTRNPADLALKLMRANKVRSKIVAEQHSHLQLHFSTEKMVQNYEHMLTAKQSAALPELMISNA